MTVGVCCRGSAGPAPFLQPPCARRASTSRLLLDRRRGCARHLAPERDVGLERHFRLRCCVMRDWSGALPRRRRRREVQRDHQLDSDALPSRPRARSPLWLADMAIRQGASAGTTRTALVTIDENDVDREHPDRMYGLARRQQQTLGRPMLSRPSNPRRLADRVTAISTSSATAERVRSFMRVCANG